MLSNRPEHASKYFFLQINTKKNNERGNWFVGTRIIFNFFFFEKLFRDTLDKIGLDGKKFTLHSIRATAATQMRKMGASAAEQMKVTGHRSEAGLRSYDRVDQEDQIIRAESLTILKDCKNTQTILEKKRGKKLGTGRINTNFRKSNNIPLTRVLTNVSERSEENNLEKVILVEEKYVVRGSRISYAEMNKFPVGTVFENCQRSLI